MTQRVGSPPKPYYASIDKVADAIESGVWGPQIQECRVYFLSDCKEAYNRCKAQLPVIMPCGKFNGQDLASMVAPTNLMILDFDHFPRSIDVLHRLRNMVQQDPYTHMCFVSVSGFGLKILVRLDNDTDNDSHHQYFLALKEYYKATYPELYEYWDDSSKNINRLCYMSHDPDLFFNPESAVWTERIAITTDSIATSTAPPDLDNEEVEKIIKYLEGGWQQFHPMVDGRRHDSTYFRAKELAEWGVPKDDALLYFKQFMSEANDPDDIRKQIDNAYEKATFNSKRRKI